MFLPKRTVGFSKTTLTELMIPAYANFGGKIHGGIVLSLMDKVAYVCAAKHSGGYCVTVSADNIDFLAPVEVGDLLSLHASVNYVGSSSMVVGIRVMAENIRKATLKHTNTSYFTMVGIDEKGNSIQIPELVLETPQDARRFIEGYKRKKLKHEFEKDFSNLKKELKKQDWHELLLGQRCSLADEFL